MKWNWGAHRNRVAATAPLHFLLDEVFAKTVETPEWKEETQRSQLVSHYLKSRDTGEFLAAENEKLTGIMG